MFELESRNPLVVLAMAALLPVAAACSQARPMAGEPFEPEGHASDGPELRPLSGELAEIAEEMTAAAQRVRGLPLLEPLRIIEGTPEVVTWLLDREMEELRRSGELSTEQVTLEAFGFIPVGGDYEALVLDLYEEQVRGVYDHRDKMLLVVPPEQGLGAGPLHERPDAEAEARMARLEISLFLVHEIVHALQDQHFGLDRFLEESRSMDEGHASRALVEGDATYAMYEMLLEGVGSSLSELPDLRPIVDALLSELDGPEHGNLKDAPLYVRETLLFAYLHGLLFVHALHDVGGLAAVNQAFSQPPTTTQQILHFEHYLDGTAARTITLQAPSFLTERGYELVSEGRLGELGLRLFLAEQTGDEPAPGVACGWAGDAYAVLSKEGERPVALWAIATRDESAAAALAFELQEALASSDLARARLVQPKLVGVVTNLDETEAEEALGWIGAAELSRPPSTPFRLKEASDGSGEKKHGSDYRTEPGSMKGPE